MQLNLLDVVSNFFFTCCCNRTDRCFDDYWTTALGVQWRTLIIDAYDSSNTTSGSCSYRKLNFISDTLPTSIHHLQLDDATRIGIYMQIGRNRIIRATSWQCILSILCWLILCLDLRTSSKILPQTDLSDICNWTLELLCLHDILSRRIRNDESFLRIIYWRLFLILQ